MWSFAACQCDVMGLHIITLEACRKMHQATMSSQSLVTLHARRNIYWAFFGFRKHFSMHTHPMLATRAFEDLVLVLVADSAAGKTSFAETCFETLV